MKDCGCYGKQEVVGKAGYRPDWLCWVLELTDLVNGPCNNLLATLRYPLCRLAEPRLGLLQLPQPTP